MLERNDPDAHSMLTRLYEMPSKFKVGDRTMRFSSYVVTNNELMSTQLDGIYGLMNEWCAYYNGFRTTVRNFPEYKKLASKKELKI